MKALNDFIPSAPRRPPTHQMSFYQDGQLVAIHSFIGAPACLAMIKLVTGSNLDGKWFNVTTFNFDCGIRVSSPQLEEIMEVTHTPHLPDPYPRMANDIARRETIRPQEASADPAPNPKAPRPPRPLPAGDVLTAADIATHLAAEPRLIRGILRKLMDKPAQGWQWPTDEAQAIIDRVKAAM